jgi:hypothetical protein
MLVANVKLEPPIDRNGALKWGGDELSSAEFSLELKPEMRRNGTRLKSE